MRTDRKLMPSATIDIDTPEGTADAYLTRPEGEAGAPGVLLFMDAYGLRPVLEELADRIAAQGFVVLVPNVFYRQGRAPVAPMPDTADEVQRTAFFAQIRPAMAQLGPQRLASDGEAYLQRLAAEAPGQVGITGYCMGARLGVWLAAAKPERVAALAGFHGGGLVTEAPDSPHRSAADLRAEVYFGHADNDRSMTPEQIALLDRALEQAGVVHSTEVYEGAHHGYTMADTAAFDQAARERHFNRLFELLERTLPDAEPR